MLDDGEQGVASAIVKPRNLHVEHKSILEAKSYYSRKFITLKITRYTVCTLYNVHVCAVNNYVMAVTGLVDNIINSRRMHEGYCSRSVCLSVTTLTATYLVCESKLRCYNIPYGIPNA